MQYNQYFSCIQFISSLSSPYTGLEPASLRNLLTCSQSRTGAMEVVEQPERTQICKTATLLKLSAKA
jgi:hypothetical protein